MKSLFLFSGGDSPLHRLDPRAKFLAVIAVLAYVLLFQRPEYMIAAFAFVIVIIWVFGHISPLQYWKLLVLFTPLIFAVALIQGLTFHPPESSVIFTVGPAQFSDAGLLFGGSIGIRLATMGITFMMFSMTTMPTDVGLALNKVGVPFRYAYLATFGLRFLPMMQDNLVTIQSARAARGDLDSGSKNPFRRLKSLPMSFFPLAANSLRQSGEIAKALELRGYGRSEGRTTVNDISFSGRDYAVVGLAVGCIVAVVYTRFALGVGALAFG